jgi:hypothetical protein
MLEIKGILGLADINMLVRMYLARENMRMILLSLKN